MAIPEKGETLRGYLLTSDFRMAGGGTCQWTFATKDSKEFFVKVFLEPKLPKPGGLGGEDVKEKRRQKCLRFERHQRELMEKVRKLVGTGGRLVAPIEFFEQDGHYYKVAHKVTVSPGAEKEITTKPLKDRLNLCINVVSALQSLHREQIVHGDLKLENILIEKSLDGGYTARVIDFDSSYIVGDPPDPDEILGDPPYYSPELLDFIQKKAGPEKLTTASDIFALGIVFTRYLTGNRPKWSDPSHNYLAEAVRAGLTPTFDAIKSADGKEADLQSLILRMVSLDPSKRPTLFTLRQELINLRDSIDPTGGTTRPPVDISDPPKPPAGPTGPISKGGIRIGKGLKPGSDSSTASSSETTETMETESPPETPGEGATTDGETVLADETEVTAVGEPPTEPAPSDSNTDIGELVKEAINLLSKIAESSDDSPRPAGRLKISKDLAKTPAPADDNRADELRAVIDSLKKIAG